jgi:hypothetical protein
MWILAFIMALITIFVHVARGLQFQGYFWADDFCSMAPAACESPHYLIFATGALILICVVLRLKRSMRDA